MKITSINNYKNNPQTNFGAIHPRLIKTAEDLIKLEPANVQKTMKTRLSALVDEADKYTFNGLGKAYTINQENLWSRFIKFFKKDGSIKTFIEIYSEKENTITRFKESICNTKTKAKAIDLVQNLEIQVDTCKKLIEKDQRSKNKIKSL